MALSKLQKITRSRDPRSKVDLTLEEYEALTEQSYAQPEQAFNLMLPSRVSLRSYFAEQEPEYHARVLALRRNQRIVAHCRLGIVVRLDDALSDGALSLTKNLDTLPKSKYYLESLQGSQLRLFDKTFPVSNLTVLRCEYIQDEWKESTKEEGAPHRRRRSTLFLMTKEHGKLRFSLENVNPVGQKPTKTENRDERVRVREALPTRSSKSSMSEALKKGEVSTLGSCRAAWMLSVQENALRRSFVLHPSPAFYSHGSINPCT